MFYIGSGFDCDGVNGHYWSRMLRLYCNWVSDSLTLTISGTACMWTREAPVAAWTRCPPGFTGHPEDLQGPFACHGHPLLYWHIRTGTQFPANGNVSWYDRLVAAVLAVAVRWLVTFTGYVNIRGYRYCCTVTVRTYYEHVRGRVINVNSTTAMWDIPVIRSNSTSKLTWYSTAWQWHTEGGVWGVENPPEIPKFWQSWAEFPVLWKIHP